MASGRSLHAALAIHGLIAEPVAEENLEALLARITPENRHGEQLDDAPRGREAW